MRRSILVVVLLTVLALSVTVSGQMSEDYWNRIADSVKVHFYTHGDSDGRELSLMCYLNTVDAWRDF